MKNYFKFMVNRINKFKPLNENFNFKVSTEEDRYKIEAVYDGEVYGSIIFAIVFDAYEYDFYDDFSDDVIPEELFYEIFGDDTLVKLEHLQVEDGFKNEGIGTQLMTNGLEFMKKQGYTKFYLNASPMGFDGLNIKNLINFYKKFGFKELLNQGNNCIMYKV